MPRSQTVLMALTLITLPLLGACGDNDEAPGAPTPPTQIESFIEGTLNPNGGQTYVFQVTRQGQVTAQITALAPSDEVVIGLSLGTFSGNACQVLLANDAATLNSTIIGTATTVGNFCVRLYDVGVLTQNVSFTVRLTHF
jgi:hypothetical protein